MDGGGVDADLLGAKFEHHFHIDRAANAAANGERDEDLVGGGGHHVVRGGAVIGGGGDVEEDEFVCPFGLIELGQLDRVAGIAEFDERDAFDHAAAIDVEAGDDAAREHGSIVESGWRNVDCGSPDVVATA